MQNAVKRQSDCTILALLMCLCGCNNTHAYTHHPESLTFDLVVCQSVENCMCILQNLTFQLEVEAPTLFSRITASAKPLSKSNSQGDVGPIGCFSPQGKSAEQEVRKRRC